VVRRAVAWLKEEPLGVEFAEIEVSDCLSARGVAIGTTPVPYRLDYELATTAGYITTSLHATTRGERWRRELVLRRDQNGIWNIAADQNGEIGLPLAGGDVVPLTGAIDCDLGLSPVTNMMPILRHGLLDRGGPIDFTMAWVDVPALAVQPDAQRYRHLHSSIDQRVVRYEAIDSSFAADITLDADGVVIDYPGIARRL
jgi:hypothetical protein